ncbi:unnamed protein product, partial [Sphagnum jensenii]
MSKKWRSSLGQFSQIWSYLRLSLYVHGFALANGCIFSFCLLVTFRQKEKFKTQ